MIYYFLYSNIYNDTRYNFASLQVQCHTAAGLDDLYFFSVPLDRFVWAIERRSHKFRGFRMTKGARLEGVFLDTVPSPHAHNTVVSGFHYMCVFILVGIS